MREYRISRKVADELEPLLAAELENYLEQRVLYRRLVEAGQHRGVKPPQKPRHRLMRLPKSVEPVVAAPVVARTPRLIRTFDDP